MSASGPPASSMNLPSTSGPNEPPPTTSTAPCAGPTFGAWADVVVEATSNATIVDSVLIDICHPAICHPERSEGSAPGVLRWHSTAGKLITNDANIGESLHAER